MANHPKIQINQAQCKKIGQIIKNLTFRPSLLSRGISNFFADQEIKLT